MALFFVTLYNQTHYSMDNNTPKSQNQIQLELKPEIAKGSYSNLAIISHSRSEFIIDFATTLPGLVKPEIGNRIIMTPEHAKRLMNALVDNIGRYEAQFGPIDLGGNAPKTGGTFNLADFGPLGGGSKS
jgi:hypothetical protein